MTAAARPTRWQVSSIVPTWVAAFADDPFFRWVFPDARARGAQLDAWFRRILRHRPAGSEIWHVAEVAAAALWHPPLERAAHADPADFVEWFAEVLGEAALVGERLAVFGRLVEPRPVEPHWYLPSVGVRPEQQGRGLGEAVLRPVLDRCDAEGHVAYLESSNRRNVPFYARLGFESIGEIVLPDDTDAVTLMRRQPRSG
ncbi:MAG: GNAT family N-acetyltransferase [Acidimicrobiia bacterium]|nr:GNAT family N-acetyltransferase [Acidimicrobiia bacterium]